MITIPVKIVGDHWLNPDEVQKILQDAPINDQVCLDLFSEGPSLLATGVHDMILESCKALQRDPTTISVVNWSNDVESVAFTRKNKFLFSHFFGMSERYSSTQILPATHEYKFGMFIGRRTGARMFMLKDMWDCYRSQCLFSLMNTVANFEPREARRGIDLESTERWVKPEEFSNFYRWCDNPPISSIDGLAVRNHYQPEFNPNLSILGYYHKFDIEIVVETYTLGDCFFPTEKTVRAIVGVKPMLVYGPKKFLSRLKDLGFQTWNNLWDESYDDFEGPERWHAMRLVIDRLSAETLPAQCLEIAQHNRQNLDVLNNKHIK